MRTIADYDQGRDNNYQLIRLIAASLVVFAHSYFISTSGSSEPLRAWIGYKHFGEVGVQIFFVISGYLVTKSFLSRKDLASYLEARFLRIFPALVVAITLIVLVGGSLATTLPLRDYLSDGRTYSYLLHNAALYREAQGLPGVFADNPFPRVVNGSLWSLFTEVRLYLLVAVLGGVGILAPRRLFNGALILGVLLHFYFPALSQYLGHILLPLFTDFRVSVYFALGAFCFINRDFVPIHWMLVVALSALALALHATSYFPIAFDLAVCYAVFYFAYAPSARWIRRFNGAGDYSYGLFIYSFPIQQLIASTYPRITALPMFVSALALTLPLAVTSWHLIEKPSLAAKGKLSGRLARGTSA